jgi:hypothetical protein
MWRPGQNSLSNDYTMGWMTRCKSQQRQAIFPIFKLSRLALKPTQSPIVWVQWFSPGADVGGE